MSHLSKLQRLEMKQKISDPLFLEKLKEKREKKNEATKAWQRRERLGLNEGSERRSNYLGPGPLKILSPTVSTTSRRTP